MSAAAATPDVSLSVSVLPSFPPLKKQRTDYSSSSSSSPGRLSRRSSDRPFQFKLRIRDAAQVVCVASGTAHSSSPFKVGDSLSDLSIIPHGSIIVSHDGRIAAVGTEEELNQRYDAVSPDPYHLYESEYDGRGLCILPGLVDGHTHPVWAGDRVHEFAQKLAGVPYMKIHAEGGGIGFTVRHTAAASEGELTRLLLQRLRRALRFGTTLLEAKSGYGLEWETELKLLRVLTRANNEQPVELVVNYCAAHSVPKGRTADEHAKDIVDHQLPKLRQLMQSGEVRAELIDVFCERGVFDVAHTRSILEAGQAIGLKANFHGDELSPIGAAEAGADIGAIAISHLEQISSQGIERMAARRCIATLLPTTAHLLRLEPPPARSLISAGVPVALGSDFNPNAHCISMPQAMFLAAVDMKLSLEECLVAATLNSAASLGKGNTHGSIETDKVADFCILQAPAWQHLIYQWADPPIIGVIKRGELVFEDEREDGNGSEAENHP